MKMHILIVEDDKLQFETIRNAIAGSDWLWESKIDRIVTELEFKEKFEELARNNPSVILMDVMLKWTTKNKMVEPPPEIDEQGFFRAGLRCEKMLALDNRTKNIPVIIYSVLGREGLESELSLRPNVRFVEKDFTPAGIEKAIHNLMGL